MNESEFVHCKNGRELLYWWKPPLEITRESGVKISQFDWHDVWRTDRVRTKAGLLWHTAVAVNVWQDRLSPRIDQTCPVCHGENESVIPQLWPRELASTTWQFSTEMLNKLENPAIGVVW